MRQDSANVPKKKVEHSIVNALIANPQFMNAIPKKICFRSAQFVSQFFQALDLNPALVLYLGLERIKPLQQGNGAVLLLVKNYPRFGHCFSLIELLAYLRTIVKGFYRPPNRLCASARAPCTTTSSPRTAGTMSKHPANGPKTPLLTI